MIPVRHINIIDKSFDVNKISDYSLRVKLLSNGIQLSVIDEQNKKCLVVEDSELNVSNPEDIKSFIRNHSFAAAGFWKNLTISFSNQKFTLLPYDEYSEDNLKTLAATSFELTDQEQLFAQSLSEKRITLLFAANKDTANVFETLYPNVPKTHHHSIGDQINTTYAQGADFQKQCYCTVENNSVSLIVTQNEKVLFGNQFSFKDPEDLTFYILYVFKHHFLNQETAGLSLYGTITPGGETFQRLSRFVKNVKLGDRPKALNFGYQFDEVADHRLFDLIR